MLVGVAVRPRKFFTSSVFFLEHDSNGVNAVRCQSCGSEKMSKFDAEVGIHFPGLKNIDKPTIFVFPKILICLNCGMAQFAVPEAQLRLLVEGDAAG
jgi:hypothetical protein